MRYDTDKAAPIQHFDLADVCSTACPRLPCMSRVWLAWAAGALGSRIHLEGLVDWDGV